MNASRWPENPLIYQYNTRLLLREVAVLTGQPIDSVTLREVPDEMIKHWVELGIEVIWLMGIWTTGGIGQRVSRENPDLQEAYHKALPDFRAEDVVGSPYAVMDYNVSPDFGGPDALKHLRERMVLASLRLILDFVPNHTARDHVWATQYPERYVLGQPGDEEKYPDRCTAQDGIVYAYGRDPYFPGWPDTFQLDYRKSETRQAMIDTLCDVAKQCDGVRCDMAMLVISDIFTCTWGELPELDPRAASEFWAQAIEAVSVEEPDFCFMAEAYWGLEGRLQQLGFHYTYNKSLYDAWVSGGTGGIQPLLQSQPWLGRSLHFMENHDEARVACAIPETNRRRAAIVNTLTLPGARMLHDGQFEARKIHHSVHLGRRTPETLDEDERRFYQRLLGVLKRSSIGRERWTLLHPEPAGEGSEQHHGLIAYLWQSRNDMRDLVVINITAHEADARLRLDFRGVGGRKWVLADALSNQVYERDGDEMAGPGLYVRLGAYEANIFSLCRGTVA